MSQADREQATNLLKAGKSLREAAKATVLAVRPLRHLRKELGLTSPEKARQQQHAAEVARAAKARAKDGTKDLPSDVKGDDKDPPTATAEIIEYRRHLKRLLPIKERAKAWAELVKQNKNLIARHRALELVDEICRYVAPKGAVLEAPIFHPDIALQVSVRPNVPAPARQTQKQADEQDGALAKPGG